MKNEEVDDGKGNINKCASYGRWKFSGMQRAYRSLGRRHPHGNQIELVPYKGMYVS